MAQHAYLECNFLKHLRTDICVVGQVNVRCVQTGIVDFVGAKVSAEKTLKPETTAPNVGTGGGSLLLSLYHRPHFCHSFPLFTRPNLFVVLMAVVIGCISCIHKIREVNCWVSNYLPPVFCCILQLLNRVIVFATYLQFYMKSFLKLNCSYIYIRIFHDVIML